MLSALQGGFEQRRLRAPLLRLALLAMSLSAVVAEEDAQLSAALARATELRLHRDPYWLTLLHYRDGRSTIDDPTFFLTSDGDRDAAGELVATLTGVLRGDAPGTPEPEHPMLGKAIAARFPARTEWLCAQLGIARADLPVDGPAQVDIQLAEIQPRGLVLVFASGYLSSPASMFGHTLLLVRGRADSPLLAQGVNYAAQVPATGSDPFSAIKGLFGVYHGLFSVLPYHRKVQEYTDLNQRDLWEYELALNPDDVRRLMLHAWELQGIWSSYWFFDENCSFNLAALLESARPGLKLSQRAGAWVLPADTVRWVRDAGLISSVSYRPSLGTRVRSDRAALGARNAALAVAIARGQQTPTDAVTAEPDPTRRAHLLDFAGQCLHALAGRHAIGARDYRVRLHATLTQRAPLGPQPALPPPTTPARPDAGHATRRFGLGGGSDDGQPFASLHLRPVLHDLADAPDGYLDGTRVAIMDGEARWYETQRPALHRLDVIGLTALNPWDGIFRRWSWEMTVGTVRERMGDDERFHTQARFDGGVGLTARLGDRGLAWSLIGADVRGFHYGDGWAAGPAATVGMAWRLPYVQVVAGGGVVDYLVGETDVAWSADLTVRTSLGREVAIDLSGAYHDRWDVTAVEGAATVFIYF